MAITAGTTSDGKTVQVGDQVSVKGVVTAVNASTGTGPGPNGGSQVSLTVQCNGAAAAPTTVSVTVQHYGAGDRRYCHAVFVKTFAWHFAVHSSD